ncbi:hypothetical protein [Microbacterium terrisoli]|jgi:hypothetical protein|uniref:hypothetical protein n=1 Tax=Microbacterium terrisoli TaxID=3242192 RepID=UPI0028058219|nr:hypothetical protein [Microbacterium protaetiae]
MAKPRWNELSPGLRAVIVIAGVVQIGLIGAAHADLSRRADAQVRGPKRMWRLISLINYVGPIAYFVAGRVPADDAR